MSRDRSRDPQSPEQAQGPPRFRTDRLPWRWSGVRFVLEFHPSSSGYQRGRKIVPYNREERMSRKLLLSVSVPVLAAALLWAAPQVWGQVFVGTPAPQQFAGQGQPSTKTGEWPTNGADLRFTRYSPLDQINASNFDKLEVA